MDIKQRCEDTKGYLLSQIRFLQSDLLGALKDMSENKCVDCLRYVNNVATISGEYNLLLDLLEENKENE